MPELTKTQYQYARDGLARDIAKMVQDGRTSGYEWRERNAALRKMEAKLANWP